MSEELPKDWKWVKIPNIVGKKGIFVDGDWIESKDQNPNGDVRLIQLADIGDGNFRDKSSRFLTTQRAKEIKCTFLSQGDILLARMPDPIGRACIFPLKGENKFVTAVDVAIIRPDKEIIDTKYLLYSLNNPSYRYSIEKLQSGTTRKRISRKNLSIINFPLPPKPTQLAIVSKIEELFSEIEKGIESLFTARQQLKTYRQSVLKLAFEGKLTEEWREKTGVRIPAAPLEGNMAAEPEPEYVIEKKHNNQKSYSSEKGELREGWEMKNLKDICKVIGGVTKGRDFKEKETIHLPYLRVANVQDGYLDLDEIKTIEVLPSDREKYELIYGDILYTEGGDKDKLGRGTIWKEEIKSCIHQNHIFRARPSSKNINSKYVAYFSQTRSAKNYFFKHGKQTTNLASINLTILSNLPIPICSMNEQNIIVEAIESRLSVADKMEESITQSLLQAEALKQSILKKAFMGKLVTEEVIKLKKVKTITKKEKAKIIRLPEQEFPRKKTVITQIDLHAGIIAMVIKAHENNPRHAAKLNHVKCEKIADQVERNLGISLGRKAVKDAAGPDDYPHLKKVEHRANMAGYFSIAPLSIGHTYKPQRNLDIIITKTKQALTPEELIAVNKLIQDFLPFELEHAELIATIFAGWNNLLIEGLNPTDEEIVYESRENWSKRKLSIQRDKFFKSLSWMKEHGFVPQGKGEMVLAPKEKKVKNHRPPKRSL